MISCSASFESENQEVVEAKSPSPSSSGSYTPQSSRMSASSASPYTARVRDTESPHMEDMQRLLTFQARQIVELERQLAQQVRSPPLISVFCSNRPTRLCVSRVQRLQIRILNWRTSGYTVRAFKGEVNHAGQVFALKLNEKGDEVASGSQVPAPSAISTSLTEGLHNASQTDHDDCSTRRVGQDHPRVERQRGTMPSSSARTCGRRVLSGTVVVHS